MGSEIITAIEARRTTVLFDQSRVLGDEQISELVRLATRAPSSFNLQNWRFIAVRTPEAKVRLRKVAWDQAKITEAAVTFIVCGQLADHAVMADRLGPAVEAGTMPAAMVPGWRRRQGPCISDSRSASATRRSARRRSARARSSTPLTRWAWVPVR